MNIEVNTLANQGKWSKVEAGATHGPSTEHG
jgi:hypothetical protein